MPNRAQLENSWLTFAKRLQAIASTGLHFGESDFDLERYQDIHDIAKQMLADLGQVPISSIDNLIQAPGLGYETPKIDVRGAVFRDEAILLVREKLDGLWTLPGGYADIGLSAAENVVKEIMEEANIDVVADRLFGVVHKAKHEYDQDAREFYKMYFLCTQQDEVEPVPGAETSAVGFFSLDNLPPLSTGRIIEKHIQMAYEYRHQHDQPTYFD